MLRGQRPSKSLTLVIIFKKCISCHTKGILCCSGFFYTKVNMSTFLPLQPMDNCLFILLAGFSTIEVSSNSISCISLIHSFPEQNFPFIWSQSSYSISQILHFVFLKIPPTLANIILGKSNFSYKSSLLINPFNCSALNG